MAEVVDTASAFTIKETTGQGREIRLVARALPYRPFSLSTTQRVEVTWYPGNPQGSPTVLGSQEEPTTLNGAWKDKYLSDSLSTDIGNSLSPYTVNQVPIRTAKEAVRIMDSVCREGQVVRVTWDEQIREGFLQKFTKNWLNTHDCEWVMEFVWISRGERVQPATFNTEASVGDVASVLGKLLSSLLGSAETTTIPKTTEFNEELGGLLDTIATTVQDAQNAVTSLARRASTPFNTARQIVSNCTGLIVQCSDLINFLENRVYDTVDISPNRTGLGVKIGAAVYCRGMINNARELRRAAILNRSVLIKQIEGDLLGVYQAKDGEDLRDIARDFYNTPFEWRRLLVFNRLTSPALVAGQVVLVPKISVGQAPR